MDVLLSASIPVAGSSLADLSTAYKVAVGIGVPTDAKYEVKLGGTGTSQLVLTWTKTVTNPA